MKVEEHHIKVEKTARYFKNYTTGENIHDFWLILHGYAQLGSDFIKEFEFLSNEDTMIVAPEGLSKFYSRNNPAASWMTKEDRLYEIEDYLSYLEKLVFHLTGNYNLSSANVNLLGFSQGVHTALRFFIYSKFNFNNLFLCCSDLPRDADFGKLNTKLSNSKMYYLLGNNDPIISTETYERNIKLLNEKNIDFKKVVFDGKHEVPKEYLHNLTKKPSNT